MVAKRCPSMPHMLGTPGSADMALVLLGIPPAEHPPPHSLNLDHLITKGSQVWAAFALSIRCLAQDVLVPGSGLGEAPARLGMHGKQFHDIVQHSTRANKHGNVMWDDVGTASA